MGSRGPAPKPNAQRRNKHEYETEIPKASQKGRPLPRTLPVTTAKAKEFWKTWASSPQSATFLETDWFELEMVTILVDDFIKGDRKLAGEIRQRVAKFGATNEDRARLRMKFEEKKNEGFSEEEAAEQLVSDAENFLKAFGGN
ncbi:terminase small subunit [Streptomyces phage Ibantik]|uniref:Terminase small subunit n=1 Tax=Streptomyces phage Ibantik TaxID=2182397 RepID=A0A2U8UNH9_9CAUD|nr:terminase small subunit [Streptomyces phage Ibantik]AWN05287.1 terminase small subunit [Streptomyces phage Ibantik]